MIALLANDDNIVSIISLYAGNSTGPGYGMLCFYGRGKNQLANTT